MIGTQVGSYRIDEKIGEGGMGTVYRGLEVNLDRAVAIKVLHAALTEKPQIVERFRTEARAQANLNHTNIAILYAFLIENGSAMMVMEYVDGENLQQLVKRRGPIPWQEAVPLFKQALSGVGAAHRMNIVHRDIKPGNIMVNKLGVVKVMDFGIAKIAGDRGLTRTGVQVGTVYYMSPEQIRSQAVDARTDVYAMGVTLYEMLTAQVPFSGESEFEVLSGHVNMLPAFPTTVESGIPKGLRNVVLKSMEKKPEDRFQTVEEFSDALDHPELWVNYAPKAIPLIAPGLAATVEMDGGSWSSRPVQPNARDHERTIAPVAAKLFWTPVKTGIVSFAAVLALGGAYIATNTKNDPKVEALRKPETTNIVPPAASEPKPAAPVPAPSNETSETETASPTVPARESSGMPLPGQYTIPSKMMIEVRLTRPLDSSEALAGQIFPARTDAPVSVDGVLVLPNRANTEVRLTKLTKASKNRPAKLEFELANLSVGGQRYTVKTDRLEILGNGTARRSGKFFGFGSGADPVTGGKTKIAKSDTGDMTFMVTPETPLSFKLRSPVSLTIRP